MSWLFKDPVVITKEILSWLSKDPINNYLAQFDHAQSNSKKWAKCYKDQIVPNEFFSRKTTNKIFMHLLASFILHNFRKTLTVDPELRGCAIFGPKIAHLSWTKFFGTNHFHYSGHAPSFSLGDGGGEISQKPLLGGGESDIFILEGKVILLGGGVILLWESRNFEVKIKIA